MATENTPADRKRGQNTVFIDTNLDTHFATIVSDSDTVSDLQKRILLEHPQCFPAIGDIKINCLKVKRRGNFYHLSDSMLVKSAFGTAKTNWFISVDASRVEHHDGTEHLNERDAVGRLALPWVSDRRSIDECGDIHVDRHSNMSLIHGSPMTHPKIVPFVNQKSENVNLDGVITEPSEDEHFRTMALSEKKSKSKKKHKSKKGEDNSVHDQLATTVPSNAGDVEDEILPPKDMEASETMPVVAMVLENPFGTSQKEILSEAAVRDGVPSLPTRTYDCEVDAGTVNGDNEAQGVAAECHMKGARGSRKHNADNKKEFSTPHTKDFHYMNKDDSLQRNLGSSIQIFEGDHIDKCEEDGKSPLNQGPEAKFPETSNKSIECEKTGGSKSKKKKAKKSAAINKDESLLMHANEPVGDLPSTVHYPAIDVNTIDERKKGKGVASPTERDGVSEKKASRDTVMYASQRGEDLIVKEVEVPQPTESNRSRVHAEDVDDKSRKGFEDTVSSKRKRKKAGRSASRNDESAVKHADIPASETAPAENILPHPERNEILEKTSTDASHVDDMIVKEVEVRQPTESNRSRMHAEEVDYKSGKEFEDTVGSKRKRKKGGRSASRNDESALRHADNLASETMPAENILPHPERKEILEKTSTDASHVDDIIVKEVEVPQPSESNRSRMHAEDVDDKLRKEFEETVGTKRKRKKVGRPPSRNDESTVKHADNLASETTPTENILPHPERKEILEKNEVEFSKPTETNSCQQNAEDIKDKHGKENENTCVDGTKKKKKKTKKSDARNEDESMVKHATGDVSGVSSNVTDLGLNGQLNDIVKVDRSTLSDTHRKDDLKEKLADVSQMIVAREGDKVKGNEAKFSPTSTDRRGDDVDGESRNKRSSTSEILPSVPIEEQGSGVDRLQLSKDTTQDEQSLDKGSVRKAKKSRKSSGRGHPVAPDKDQSTGLELEPEKSKDMKHQTSLPGEISKDVVSSEVSKGRTETKRDVNNQFDVPKDVSHEIDFVRYFVPGQNRDDVTPVHRVKDAASSEREKKPEKKQRNNTKELHVETSSDLRNILASNTNQQNGKQHDSKNDTDVGQVNKKHQSSLSQSRGAVKTASSKKAAQVVNGSRLAKSLLNTPGAIFGDGSDDSSADDNGSVNSDASTRTPSDKSSSSGEESERDSSLDLRRNGSDAAKRKEGGGQNIINSQTKLSMSDILRRSSVFKKAKLSASQQMEDTESQPVDFVPESEPM